MTGRCDWVKGEEGHDKIGQAHFRQVSEIGCCGPAEVSPGGEQCVTINIKGASFMVITSAVSLLPMHVLKKVRL